MKTAYEFLKERAENYTDILPDGIEYFHMVCDKDLIDFAKMHVIEALKKVKDGVRFNYSNLSDINKSINEAYPLESIK